MDVIQNLTVNKAIQTISFSTISDQTLQDSPITLQASATSGLIVVFDLIEGDGMISGDQLTLNNVGVFRIEARQNGNANYEEVSAEQSFMISNAPKQDQAITFRLIPTKLVGDVPFALVATASSGLEVIFSRLDETIASISGNEVTIHGVWR